MDDNLLSLGTLKSNEIAKYEDILYSLYLQSEIEKGIEDMENGDGVTTSELKEMLNDYMDKELHK